MRQSGLLLVTVLVLGACASSPSGQTTGTTATTAPTETSTTTTTAPTETSMPDDSDPNTPPTSMSSAPIAMVETAIDDLASRLGVDPRRIRLIESRGMTWPDGSLGCPQPDESYFSAQVDGYLVMISHEDRVFSYHAGSDALPFLCPSDEKDGGRRFIPPPGFDT